MRTLFKPLTILLSVMLLFLTAACASGSSSTSGSAPTSGSQQSSSPQSPSPTPKDTVKTIKHAMGTAEIKGTPKRIVALEWTYVEDLLAVGVQPAGVADIKGYKTWVNVQPALAADTVDVGTRQEPNLEAITGLKPDLIITASNRAKSNYESLNKIAPTIVFESYPPEGAGDQYAEMEQTFKTIADLAGKTAEADKVLKDLQKTYDDTKAKLKAANKDGAEFSLTQAFSNQNAAVLRMFTDNSMAVQILQRAGMKNVYKSSKFEIYGFATGSIESLPSVQNASFFYIVQDNDNVFDKQLKDNAVWKGLNFVKENQAYKLPGNTWPFGGPLSAKVFVELTADAMIKGSGK
ncbi:ABC transporter substrate-binding protein [Paenibacillus sedimenti]|uniref:Iron-siderophore ABC transporter substrate-binding protein n=1 Tax=Paenibacillus sedimenti TaxID=2770274 RepID=A0A926KTZ0_9BACL|nr:iron-siderophore ABC transporter substrate-binding protein [Paenibacillus sedimenti]MBD0383985.1 iron-siderophore ABC transporter substrate-binding protein [Paenibacillus sedimenti]